MGSRSVSIERDVVKKCGAPNDIRVEVVKTSVAYDVSVQTGMFRVPKIVDADPDRGWFVMERIPGIRGVGFLRSRKKALGPFLRRVGSAISEIHNQMTLPDDLKKPMPPEWDALDVERQVYFHGDLSIENVAYVDGSDVPVIIDWHLTPRIRGGATWGPRYFDICWLIAGLFRVSPLKLHLLSGVRDAIDELLDGYFGVPGTQQGTVEDFFAFQRRFARVRMSEVEERLSPVRRVLVSPSLKVWRAYVNDCRRTCCAG